MGICFDAGPLITLSLNDMLWIIEKLSVRYTKPFFITPAVKKEIIDKPLNIKRFEYQAILLLNLLTDGYIKLFTHHKLSSLSNEIELHIYERQPSC